VGGPKLLGQVEVKVAVELGRVAVVSFGVRR